MTDQGGNTGGNTGGNGGGGGGGGNTGLALIVGALLVVVAVIAFFMVSNGGAPEAPTIPDEVDINVNLPEAPAAPAAPSNGG